MNLLHPTSAKPRNNNLPVNTNDDRTVMRSVTGEVGTTAL